MSRLLIIEDEEAIADFEHRYDEILALARKEYEDVPPSSYNMNGYNLYLRLQEYKHNHLLFLRNRSVPPTNNLSERGLRQVKTKMKVSGQFESEAAARNYAIILSYVETCRRNNINEIDALRRLCEGNQKKKKKKKGI